MRDSPAGRHAAAWLAVMLCAVPAAARQPEPPLRTRVALGAQFVPGFPGSRDVRLRPLVDVARARGERPFAFEAPDESFGFPVLRAGDFALGPALGIEGSRTAEDVGAALPKVGLTFEAGAFVQYALGDRFRIRIEARQGLGGHEGLIGTVGADVVARRGDDWLFSAGPRLTFADARYHRAYFSVAPADSAASGLPAYSAEGGLQAAGVTTGYLRQLSRRWGLYSYAKYDRLIGDPAGSPIVRRYGARDQFSGGLGLTYTFRRD